jgi:mannitol/fructose-specific phosphotransferase system IIA component (Ntr-type)
MAKEAHTTVKSSLTDDQPEHPLEGLDAMTLGEFTEPGLLVPRLLSNHRESAIIELSIRLEKIGRIEHRNAFVNAALDHEEIASAVINGVTFPLARGRAVTELSFAVGFSPEGIRWGAGWAPIVHTVVLLAVPLTEARTHMSLMLTFANFITNEIAFTAFRRATQPEEMLALLNQTALLPTGPQLGAAM